MTVGERIKTCRQNTGMSQEKIADLIGVSRQAVTKWEADQSAPNTENLFKLAELFGTTVDMLLDTGNAANSSAVEQFYTLFRMEDERKRADKRKRRKENLVSALIVVCAYLTVYLIGRLIWCDRSNVSLLGWLVSAKLSGSNSYLYGWLLSSNLFWIAMAISAVPSLFGKHRFSFVTLIAFALGLLAGIVFGPNPAGAPYGHGHYGWAIWGGIYLLSIIIGIVAELYNRKK